MSDELIDREWQRSYIENVEQEYAKLEAENAKLRAVVVEAKILRIYCLGSDCSTQNMITRFDEVLKKLEDVE